MIKRFPDNLLLSIFSFVSPEAKCANWDETRARVIEQRVDIDLHGPLRVGSS